MQLALNDADRQFIEEQVRAGHFKTAESLVELALRYFRAKLSVDTFPVSTRDLRSIIAVGIKQADRGELMDGAEALRARRRQRKLSNSKKNGKR